MVDWHVKDDPHYAWFEVMEGDRQVANVDRKEDAERIVAADRLAAAVIARERALSGNATMLEFHRMVPDLREEMVAAVRQYWELTDPEGYRAAREAVEEVLPTPHVERST